MEQAVIEDGNRYLHGGWLHRFDTLDHSADDYILLDLISIISEHSDFEDLTSKEYRLDLREVEHAYFDELSEEERKEELATTYRPAEYTRDTQQRILQWRPSYWWIPDRTDLDTVMRYMPICPETSSYDHSGREHRPKHYFSAAAVAIRLLQRLSPKTRMHLRNIVIEEDNPSIAMPRTHAQGLIPFCRANPKLRVQRRVDIWRTDLVQENWNFEKNDHSRWTLLYIAIWIQEAKLLHQMGMPTDSFSLVLHGPILQTSQQLSDGVIKAAIWHDGAVEIARREKKDFVYFRHGVAEDFVEVIKGMVKGDIPATFDADMDGLWNLEEVLNGDDWPAEIKQVFDLTEFEEPDGGWAAARNECIEEIDWADRMDGWNVLIATA